MLEVSQVFFKKNENSHTFYLPESVGIFRNPYTPLMQVGGAEGGCGLLVRGCGLLVPSTWVRVLETSDET